jgi:hypothetical protein
MPGRFKKNDQLTLFGSWDDKGIFWHRNVVVASCGKQRMTLLCANTGEMLGRDFDPAADRYAEGYGQTEAALEFGRQWLTRRRTHLAHCFANIAAGAAYQRSIQKSIDELALAPTLIDKNKGMLIVT